MAKKKVKITGLKQIKQDLKKVVNRDLPKIAALEYRKLLIRNLQPSKKSGALIKSWKIKTGIKKAMLSSDLPYAEIQNFGGRIRITERMRSKMWALYKETGLQVYKAIASTKKNSITIPAKNYYNVNNRLLNKLIDKQLNKKTKRI